MRYDCLIIDDEKELADNTCDYFNLFGVNTHALYGVNEAKAFLDTNEVSLILLDINLQDGSGFDLCKYIRQTKQIPILFISARNTDDDKIIALNIGGDDYIEKPYSMGVLLAKVKVFLKRFGGTSGVIEDVYDDGRIRVDKVNKTLEVNGEARKLTKESLIISKEFSNPILTESKNTWILKIMRISRKG